MKHAHPVLLCCGGPGMGDDLEVKVLPEPGRRDRREAQGVLCCVAALLSMGIIN